MITWTRLPRWAASLALMIALAGGLLFAAIDVPARADSSPPTFEPNPTFIISDGDTPTPEPSPIPTEPPTPDSSETPTSVAPDTLTPTDTLIPSETPTLPETWTPTETSTSDAPPTVTDTNMPAPTETATDLVADTPTPTAPDPATPTDTSTAINTATATDVATATDTATAIDTATPTPSDTPTPTPSLTPTYTPLPLIAFGLPPVPPETQPILLAPLPPLTPSTSLVLSQIYGGGGNTGATYRNDFIEIYNLSASPISVNGWSVQYASATGTTWSVTALTGTISAGGYFLIQEAAGAGGTASLPTPDITDTIAMAATAGKVALVNTSTLLTCGASANDCFPNSAIIDFVGYGTTANNYEGAGYAPAPSNTTADLRAGGGATDTDDNSADFSTGTPNPRNSASSATATPTYTPTYTPTPTDTGTPTNTATPSPTLTDTGTPTPTSTSTDTPTATSTATAYPALAVVINEVAWGGTISSTADEWIELYNPSGLAVNLAGWTVASLDGSPTITLTGFIPANGYYLLERTNDTTIADVLADQIYTGALTDSGETLQLKDPGGNLIDSANGDSGAWPAGSASPNHYSMERINPLAADSDSNWASNNGVYRNGLDVGGNPINGTPRQANSTTFPTPTPTPAPTATSTGTPTPTPTTVPALTVVINEVAWSGTAASSSDEWIELYNSTGATINLAGWTLASLDGSPAITLMGLIPAGGYFLLERTDDSPVSDISADQIYSGVLGNGGETLLLKDPGGYVIDSANGNGGAWPAGSASPNYASMERVTSFAADSDFNWQSNNGVYRTGRDASGNPLNGSPKMANSTTFPTLTPSHTPTATPSHTPGPSPTPTNTGTPTNTPPPSAHSGAVVVNEIVTDPQQDWSGNGFSGVPFTGTVSDVDEFVELYIKESGLDLTGWTIDLLDTSPVSGDLTSAGAFQTSLYIGSGGTFNNTAAGDYLVLGNPRVGSLNNTLLIVLKDNLGAVVDEAQIGAGGAPDGGPSNGNATGPADEAIARVPNGRDTGNDIADFVKQAVTLGASNGDTPPLTFTPLAVVVNEIAWAGTSASSSDEWLELYNPTASDIPLAGWLLADGGDLNILFPVGLVIPSNRYLLLERTDDNAVSDLPADLIYSGVLSNSGKTLTLRDPAGNVIDTANADEGAWPGGSDSTYATMERINPSAADSDANWQSNTGLTVNGHDADGNPLRGTPRSANSYSGPPPGGYSSGVLINEFLPHPASGSEEFIELFNTGGAAIDISGWQLDDASGGSSPYFIPLGTILQPGAFMAFFKSTTDLALNDDGDSVRLLHPDGSIADEVTYDRDPKENVSWARVPDGGDWNPLGIPTPGGSNQADSGASAPGGLTAPDAASAIPIGMFRPWPDGAWVNVTGRVTVPPALFGQRVIYIQDETGGVVLYLGRGDWPALAIGQTVSVLGYLRHRSGELQVYIRNLWHVVIGPAESLAPAVPLNLTTAQIGEATEGNLVTVQGRVTKLESQAFWLDDGSGPRRVFFSAATGLQRPKVKRGEIWRVTGMVIEHTTSRDTAAKYRLQPRFAFDVTQLTTRFGAPLVETPVPAEPPSTEEPTATPDA